MNILSTLTVACILAASFSVRASQIVIPMPSKKFYTNNKVHYLIKKFVEGDTVRYESTNFLTNEIQTYSVDQKTKKDFSMTMGLDGFERIVKASENQSIAQKYEETASSTAAHETTQTAQSTSSQSTSVATSTPVQSSSNTPSIMASIINFFWKSSAS